MPKSASDSPSLAPSRKFDRDMQIPPETQVVIDFDDNRAASALVGPYGQNLALVERRLGVVVDSRGNHITIAGSRDGCDAARRVLETLYAQAVQGHDLSQGEVEGAIRVVLAQGSLFEFDPKTAKTSFETINLRKRPVRARTAAQDSYIRALKRHEMVFGVGPAGTGKTWLAVAHAAQLFERKEVDRIILSRPAVEAGERLGFLPGDLREKVDPYLRPIYDALYDLMDSRIVERALQAGEIEIAPLAFMRGRTLTNAVIILDEAQNTTSMQMKMFLTRLGENSRMIITGDPSQVDLPNGQASGLAEAVKLLDGVEGIAQVKFTAEDVIRHELVARIVAAYEGLPQKPATRQILTQKSSALDLPQAGPGRNPNIAMQSAGTPVSSALPLTEVLVVADCWQTEPEAEAVIHRAINAAAEIADADVGEAELAVMLTDDAGIRTLNNNWRGIDKPTNVLSFPALQPTAGAPADAPRMLGDIAIAYETTRKEADDEEKPFDHHLSHLAVHGFLHLIGYDHEKDDDAEAMEGLEREILAQLGIPDPYADRERMD